jgi:integrase
MSATARRIRSARHAGVYYRELDNGRRRYEITYIDSDGRRRWQVVDGGERDAVAARAEIVTAKRKGQRVAPSRRRFQQVAEEWLAENTGELRPSSRQRYEKGLEHAYRAFGRQPISEVDENDVARLISRMRKAGKAPWTVRVSLTVVSGVMRHAVRRGWAAANPVPKLEKGERPKVARGGIRILEREEITRVLEAATPYWRPLLALLVFSGLRIGEALALRWGDVDFDAGVIRVRMQLDERTLTLVEPKTEKAKREVVMFPTLAKLLREHRLASPPGLSGDDCFVFAKADGSPRRQGNAREGFKQALKKAGLAKLRVHDLRHTFVSLLLSAGRDVVFVSRQVGHSSPSITLNVYSHLFDHARHADETRAALEASFGGLLETVLETYPRQPPAIAAPSAGAEVLAIPLR